MIDKRGEPIVMDFGLACRLDDNWETKLTQDGAVIGTPSYMSPEQIDHRAKVGPQCDVYSLGVMMYELLTGQCPYSGSLVSVIGQVLHAEPKPVAELRPDVAPALAAICARAMAKKTDERYGSMKELAHALSAFLKGEAASASALQELQGAATVPDLRGGDLQGLEALLSESAPAAHAAQLSAPALRPAPSTKLSRGAILGIAGGLAAVLIAVIGVIAATGSGSKPAASGSAGSAPTIASLDLKQPDKTTTAPTPPTSTPAAAPAPAAPASAGPKKVDDAKLADDDKDSASLESAGPNDDEPESGSEPEPDGPPDDPRRPPPPDDRDDPDRRPPPPPPEGDRGPGFGPGADGRHSFEQDFAAIKSVESLEAYFKQADRNNDQRLDPTELPMHVVMRAGGKPGTRGVTLNDLKKAWQKKGAKLFEPPTEEEMRKLPKGPPPGGPRGPGGPGGMRGGPPGPGGPGGGPGGPPRGKRR